MFKFLSLIGFLLGTSASFAAEFDRVSFPGFDQEMILLSGEIVEGDTERFLRAIEGVDRATIVLESPGGLIHEAFSVGAEISNRGYATQVLPDTSCYSACALIWLTGQRRYMSQSSTIGVHAAYYEDEGGSLNITGAGNAEIGAFLAHIGLRREAIRYITTAKPDEDFLYLTPQIARTLGIEIFEQNGLETATPLDRPTAPRIIHEVAQLFAFEVNCGPLFGTNGQAERTAKSHLRYGHAEFGGERFASLLPEAVDLTKAKIASEGELSWCLESSVDLLRAGFDLGISGPAYDCSRASTVNEMTICQTPGLWGLDLALSAFYSAARSQLIGQSLSALKARQVEWLRIRQRCETDTRCTGDLYFQRIGEILR